MKNLRTCLLCASLILSGMGAFAQEHKAPINEPDYNKPKLFTSLPDNIAVNPAQLFGAANKTSGNNVDIRLSDAAQVSLQGTIVSAETKFDGKLQSVVIKSSNFNGATFTLSKIVDENGAVSYTGRLISFQHGDLYVLQHTGDQYKLVKKNFYDLVNE